MSLQEEMGRRTAGVPRDRQIKFRIGVNLGDVIVDDDGDVFGDGVNVAARLEPLAIPGGICISGPVYTSIQKKLDVKFTDLGYQRVKNISTPIHAYDIRWPGEAGTPDERAVKPTAKPKHPGLIAGSAMAVAAIIGLALWQMGPFEPGREAAPKNSLAVLPFVNMSDDAGNEYFSDGITEEILNLLARTPELKVISRSSAFSFKGKGIQFPEIARSLNVAHILEGSVRKAGDQVRITAQLIDARTDTHLWSETYDRNVLDVFAVQEDIAGEIARQLELTLVSARSGLGTKNEEAYDHYLRGLHLINQMSDTLKARDHFQAAVDLDPGYAKAYALLSVTLNTLGSFRILPPSEVLPRAHEAARTALELDDNLYLAHVALGWFTLTYERDWNGSEKEFRRAIELAPGAYEGHMGLAIALQVTGRYDEALAEMLEARNLDPLSLWIRSNLADVYYRLRDYETALEVALSLLKLTPDDALGAAFVGQLYAENHQPAEAASYAKRAASLTGGDPNLDLGVALVYATLGDQTEAREILHQIDPEDATRFVSPGYLAAVYANLGENDLAMENLARGVEEYDSFIFNLNYPMWDPIRSDPRFVALCEGLKMACAGSQGS
jgi:TolB-like protein/Flp pilus assembly protein TadD